MIVGINNQKLVMGIDSQKSVMWIGNKKLEYLQYEFLATNNFFINLEYDQQCLTKFIPNLDPKRCNVFSQTMFGDDLHIA